MTKTKAGLSQTGPATTDTHTTTSTSEFTRRLIGLQRTEPLTAEDRADLAVLLAAAARGFRLTTRCVACNRWLAAPRSVLQHLGPVCAARQVAAQ